VAAEGGSIKIATKLLAMGFDLNEPDDNGFTPLHNACYEGDIAMAEFLISHGADIQSLDGEGRSILHNACNGDSENNTNRISLVKKLLNLGLDINSASNDGSSPLSYACYNGNQELVELLIDHGADIHTPNHEGQTLLHDICNCSSEETEEMVAIVSSLLERGLAVNARSADGSTPLSYACSSVYPKVVNLLIDHGADPLTVDRKGNTLLHDLCNSGAEYEESEESEESEKMVELLEFLLSLDLDANVRNTDGMTPLGFACFNNRPLMV
jgi:ankyrin repeat protein